MRLNSLLPRSLVGRVFALYAATLTAFVVIGLALFLQHQYESSVRAAADDARTMFSVLVPMYPLGLIGLWGARHGTFPPRRTAVPR